jgi:alkylation response protein AidB-like acyl-CoA dehydrogenase
MNFLDLDLSLTKEDIALKKSVHEFAKKVMRPIAKELDEMTPEQVIAEDSPLWNFMRKAYELEYHLVLFPEEAGGMGLTPLQQAIVFEELAWGSMGLAVNLVVCAVPAFLATILAPDNEQLRNEIILPFVQCKDGSLRGSWAATEPDHGSDHLFTNHPIYSDPEIGYQCLATLEGDEWVINGQKSAWVSGATISTHCALFCRVDPSMGLAGGGIFIVPLDLPGVKKGAPLDKLGQRDLNQGELFFDNVRIPKSYAIMGPEAYQQTFEALLSITTSFMGLSSTGLARAAFDEALSYAKTRVQGGNKLADYPTVQVKLFNMFQQIECSRYISRAAYTYNRTTTTPAKEYSVAAKLQGTQTAFNVAHEAIQIFGGNGLTKEYLVEKLFRDARATLIEDGSNDILAIGGGHKLVNHYPRRR